MFLIAISKCCDKFNNCNSLPSFSEILKFLLKQNCIKNHKILRNPGLQNLRMGKEWVFKSKKSSGNFLFSVDPDFGSGESKYELKIPMGHTQTQPGEKIPFLMQDFRTGGTPWGIVIGPDRKVLLNGYKLDYEITVKLIRQFKDRK